MFLLLVIVLHLFCGRLILAMTILLSYDNAFSDLSQRRPTFVLGLIREGTIELLDDVGREKLYPVMFFPVFCPQ